MKFKTAYNLEHSAKADDYVFIFAGPELLLVNEGLPRVSDVPGIEALDEEPVFLGELGESSCLAASVISKEDFSIPETAEFLPLRSNLSLLGTEEAAAAGFASHILHWHNRSRYCGVCGSRMDWLLKERAKHCDKCGNTDFPRISPAIIIGIEKDGKILLAHNRRFPDGRYSVLAGFMEPGETIEETAEREVFEEVGIRIKNIKYLASQSWSFPDSLMIGLTAEYAGGEIKPDGVEIEHADWFTADNFPAIPDHRTIARKIIDEYAKKN